jgi:hypothetical protein
VKSKEGAQDLAENEIADDFKDIKIDAAPLNPAGPEMQPLAAPAQPLLGGAAGSPASAPVQSALYQSPGGKHPAGAWLDGTIIEDGFDTPATRVSYGPPQSRPQ